jgi:prevent-host-death family protein
MLNSIPASLARSNFGEIIRRVYEGAETLVVERAGLPVVAIISIDELERLLPEQAKTMPRIEMSAKRERAWKDLINFLQEPGSEQYSDADVEADVLNAVEEVRYGKRQRSK